MLEQDEQFATDPSAKPELSNVKNPAEVTVNVLCDVKDSTHPLDWPHPDPL